MSQNYAVIAGGAVINIVIWDGVSPWTPPAGTTIVPTAGNANAQIGGTYDGSTFTPAPAPPPTI
jgi:hypothetical protein